MQPSHQAVRITPRDTALCSQEHPAPRATCSDPRTTWRGSSTWPHKSPCKSQWTTHDTEKAALPAGLVEKLGAGLPLSLFYGEGLSHRQ